MLFNSLTFLIFFSVVTIIYFSIPHKYRWFLLLSASCYFYMFFIPAYVLILLFTIVIDYYAGIKIENTSDHNGKKRFLILSIIANVGILAFFKYYNFFNDNLTSLLGIANQKNPIPYLNIILPVGLSFHTFQAMSYTIEVYRGNQKAERHLGYYALYVMYYPQLVAGPIERPQNILHQLYIPQTWNTNRVMHGLQLMLWGLIKKVIVADRLAIKVNEIYTGYNHVGGWGLMIGAVLFSFQIYCDFSGYSDIAIGASKIMGIDLMKNFNKPYFSKSISEFWARWHISLSTWFRDYVYIPLGGNRVKEYIWLRNIFVVFILSGFWHGASWNFIVWGGLHAVLTISEILIRKFLSKLNFGNITTKILFNSFTTFIVVTVAWIFFRAENLGKAFFILKEIVYGLKIFIYQLLYTGTFSTIELYVKLTFPNSEYIICYILILLLLCCDKLFNFHEEKINGIKQFIYFLVAILLISILGISGNEQFIYFQF